MNKKDFNTERLFYCFLVSLVMIPTFIFSSLGLIQTYQLYQDEILEKKYIFIECNDPSLKFGLYLSVQDEFGNREEIIFDTSLFYKQYLFLDEVKEGSEIYISFDKSNENYAIGLRTKNKVYYDVSTDRKEKVVLMIILILFAFFRYFLK